MNKTVRIAFCENGAGYGGAIISLAAFLKEKPATLTPFVYTSLGGEEYRRLSALGTWRRFKPWRLAVTGWLKRRAVPFASLIDNLANVAPEVLRYCLAFKRDRIVLVYLNNDPISNLAPAMAAWLCGLPTVLHMRGFCDDTASSRWVLQRVTQVIAVSQWIREDLLTYGVPPACCTVVPEGLDLELFSPRPADQALRSSLGLGAEAPVITLVGGLVEWKGQDVLLAACPQIFARFPEARVLLVGSTYGNESGYVKQVRQRAGDEAMAGRVQLLGLRSDVPALLALSTIVLHASTQPEPFGRTFLEGMAMGRAVIASAAGGPVEVITHGEDGLLVEPGNVQQLVDAVIELLSDPSLRQALGRRACETARAYSIRSHVAQIDAVLGKC